METQQNTQQEPQQAVVEQAQSIKKQADLLKIVYALYAGSFIIPIACIAGVVIAYIKREDVADTYMQSHYQWLIRTFWWSTLFGFFGFLTFVFGIGFLILMGSAVWFVYRVIKGFLKFNDGLAI